MSTIRMNSTGREIHNSLIQQRDTLLAENAALRAQRDALRTALIAAKFYIRPHNVDQPETRADVLTQCHAALALPDAGEGEAG